MSDTDTRGRLLNILTVFAAFVSMVVATGFWWLVGRGTLWILVASALILLPHFILIGLLARGVPGDAKLGPLTRGLARGFGSMFVSLWVFCVVSAGVYDGDSRASIYLALLTFVPPFAFIAVPFLFCQVLLIRAGRLFDGGRTYWAGFTLPWVCAIAVIGGTYTLQRVEKIREAQRSEEAARPYREAAAARARALDQLPRGDIAWEIDLPLPRMTTPSGVFFRQEENGEVSVSSNLGIATVDLHNHAARFDPTPTFPRQPDWRTADVTFGELHVVRDGENRLKALDRRGEVKWNVRVPGAYTTRAIASNGMLVAASPSDIVAFDFGGREQWRFSITSVSDEHWDSGSVSIGADNLVSIARRHEVIALRNDGRLAWVFRLDPRFHWFVYSASFPSDDGVAIVIADFVGRPRARFAMLHGPVAPAGQPAPTR